MEQQPRELKEGFVALWEMPKAFTPTPASLSEFILRSRDVTGDQIPAYLDPSTASDPYYSEIGGAARWLSGRKKGRALVFGDYDVDGCTSVAIMEKTLRTLGWEVETFVPNRFATGYGVNIPTIEKIHRDRPFGLLVTVDCGSASLAELGGFAEKSQVPVMVIDHHIPGGEVPKGVFEVNPARDPAMPEGGYCAALLCYLVAEGMASEHSRLEPILSELKSLAGMASIADVVKTRPPAARTSMIHFLKTAGAPETNPGVQFLLRKLKTRMPLSMSDAQFQLIPRLNAAGRLDDAGLVVRLFRETEIGPLAEISDKIETINEQRKVQQEKVEVEARNRVQHRKGESASGPLTFVLEFDENWNPGVVGVAAGRIAEKIGGPCFLGGYNESQGIYNFSGRSGGTVNIKAIMDEATKGLSIKGGGHAAAMGFKVPKENIAELEILRERLGQILPPKPDVPVRQITAFLHPHGISEAKYREVQALEPFGHDNPKPIFGVFGVKLALEPFAKKPRSGRGVATDEEGRSFPVVYFENPKMLAASGVTVAAVGTLHADNFEGKEQVKFQLLDVIKIDRSTPGRGGR